MLLSNNWHKPYKELLAIPGEIIWDASKPDGTPRKLMDVSKLKEMGWEYTTELEDGIKHTYNWFLANIDNYKQVKLT